MSEIRDAAVEPAHRDIRMDGVTFSRAALSAPFARRLRPGTFSYCVCVRRGQLRLATDFPTTSQVDLKAGDMAAVSGLAPHVFMSPGADALSPIDIETTPMDAAPGPGDTELIVGSVPSEALALGSLMGGLILVHPAEHPTLSRRLWRAVEMIEDEYAEGAWLDRNLVIRRAAEIMLVNMTRRVISERAPVANDAGRPLASRQLVKAINAFFDMPERPWTLDQLARAAGMSRSRFADEFKAVTGGTPARLIARLRLTSVARRLTNEALSVDAAADVAGYSSAAAFVRAFQREFGQTPARWRRERGVALPDAASRNVVDIPERRSRP